MASRRRRHVLVGIGGACVLALALCLAVVTATRPLPDVDGPYGIKGLALFGDANGTSYGEQYATSLLVPMASTIAGQPTITGTEKRDMLAEWQLARATRALEDQGDAVGYILLDLKTGTGISHDADKAFYAASAIKGPYVTCVVSRNMGRSTMRDSFKTQRQRIANIIENSDNDSYLKLRASYGSSTFTHFANESGANVLPSTPATGDIANAQAGRESTNVSDDAYAFMTPAQLLALWRESYDYLTSDSEAARWLGEEFSKPVTSAIRGADSSTGTTWSKAGWYPSMDSSPGLGTSVDAGVVRTDQGDYLLAVMTTNPEDMTSVESIVAPLIALRDALVA